MNPLRCRRVTCTIPPRIGACAWLRSLAESRRPPAGSDPEEIIHEHDKTAPKPGEDIVNVDDLAAIRAENEAVRRQLASPPSPKIPKSESEGDPLWRKVIVGVLVLLAIVMLVASVTVASVKTTILDEDRFVATLESFPYAESAASVISTRVTDGVVEASGVEARVAGSLPDGLKFLSVPATESISTAIAGAANEVILSDAFSSVWSRALRATHKAASAVISGNGGALASEGGVVSINLYDTAGVVVEKVEATGLELPDDEGELGSIVVSEDQQLAAVQSLAQAIDTLGWFLALLALVFIALAIWISRDRRRTTAILGFGSAIGVALSLVGLRYGRSYVVNAIEDATKHQAAGDAWDLILNRLAQMMWAAPILSLIGGIIAWVLEPSARSVRTRTWASGAVERWRQPAEDRPNSLTAFVAGWKPTIGVVAVVIGLGFILFGPPPTGFSVLLTAVIVLGVIVVTEVLAAPEPEAVDSIEIVEDVEDVSPST